MLRQSFFGLPFECKFRTLPAGHMHLSMLRLTSLRTSRMAFCGLSEERIRRGKEIAAELTAILRQLSDSEVGELLGKGAMDDLMRAILDPKSVKEYPNIAEFLVANKTRSSLLALVRYAITRNYSFKAGEPGKQGFVSPHFVQWFDDGVMFLEGGEPFAGLIGLYRNKEMRYAVAARDARSGEQMGKEDFEFVTVEDAKARMKAIPASQISDLEKPIRQLNELLAMGERDESCYQRLLQEYPWILSTQYECVQDHTNLDDENIPDFTGVRIHDRYRDIVEIKSPFIQVLRKDGELTSEFNEAWNQSERYLNFAREEKDYLRRKGLSFENPKCFLILGYQLDNDSLKKMGLKQRMNPAIEIRTYDGLIAVANEAVKFIKNLQRKL